LGVLLLGRADWTPITLFRQSTQDGPVNVMFELLGGGEAVIDSVEVRVWERGNDVVPPTYPLSANSTTDTPISEFSR